MTTRLIWSLVLTGELAALAVIMAIVSGWLPAPIAVQLWGLGVCAMVAAVLAIALPRPGRAALHGLLIIGSLVFLLPIGWLVSTSFKQPEETFVFPPAWIPELAEAGASSPWKWSHAQPDAPNTHELILERVQLQFRDGGTANYDADWSTSGAAWSTVPVEADGSASSHGRIAQYHFTDELDEAVFSAEIDPMLPGQAKGDLSDVRSVALRFQADDSWHGLSFEIDRGADTYRTEDLLSIAGNRWVEWTFDMEAADSQQRDLGIWPMRRVDSSSGDVQRLHLRVIVKRRSPIVATACKWTQSYRDAWYADPLWPRYLLNSVFLVAMNILGQLLACSMAAFAFSRLRWSGRDAVFAVVISTMMLPGIVMLIPQFLIFRSLGWYNTLLPLWVPALAGAPFYIFIMRQFMLGLPRELDEAARIDGCSWVGVYLRIILPLTKPALAAVAVFTFMATWNEFMGPLIYLNDARLYPLPMGLYSFRTDYETRFNMLMAASTLMVIPAIAIFFCAQRYFIRGASFAGVNR